MKELILRCCRHNRTSFKNFKWPERGYVECPDWKPKPECGNGLHGWLRGTGSLSAWREESEDLWIVGEVEADSVVNLGDKVKFPACEVIYCGNREEAVNIICQYYPAEAVIYSQKTISNHGYGAVGDKGVIRGGVGSKIISGYGGASYGGDISNAISGPRGISYSGFVGRSTSGASGKAYSLNQGISSAGISGVVSSGRGGQLRLDYFDKEVCYRTAVAYVGENGIKEQTEYMLNAKFEFVEVPQNHDPARRIHLPL